MGLNKLILLSIFDFIHLKQFYTKNFLAVLLATFCKRNAF